MDLTEFINSIPNLADDEEPERTEVYRVWAKGRDSVWFAVSQTFDDERDAENWALHLNLQHRVEPEDPA
jgi:hypothetical protein